MDPEKNLQNIKAMYEAYGEGDVLTPLMDLVTDDVKWAVSYMPCTSAQVRMYEYASGIQGVHGVFQPREM